MIAENTPLNPRNRILELSFHAFNSQGYKNVSMDVVARELRISKKTIYKHFDAKEEILETGIEQLFERIESELGRLSHGVEERDEVLAYFFIYRDFVHSLSENLRAEIARDIPYLHERIKTFERQVLKRTFGNLLKDLRSRRLIEYPSPTREFTGAFFSMLKGLVDVPDDKARYIIHSLYRGMSVRKKKKGKNSSGRNKGN